jgi:hypothetical protein
MVSWTQQTESDAPASAVVGFSGRATLPRRRTATAPGSRVRAARTPPCGRPETTEGFQEDLPLGIVGAHQEEVLGSQVGVA